MSWEKVKLGDIADFSNGIDFGKDAYARGVKLIGVSNFANRYYPNYEELEEIREEIVRPSDYLQSGDIVFVRSNGNKELVGRCMLIDKPPTKVTFSGFCIRARLKNLDENDPYFWTYYFKCQQFRRAMSKTAIGTNIQNLSQGRLKNYEATIPRIEVQKRIAEILLAYDNLMEKNQKQIKLLEEAAHCLYKEWFVDLRFPGYESAGIVDGIPKGWSYKKIADCGTIVTGKTPSTLNSTYYGGKIPFVKIPDMRLRMYPLQTERKLTDAGANSQKNKFIPKNSLLVSCIGTAGLVNISCQDCQTNQQIHSLVLNNKYDLYYLYFVFKSLKDTLNAIGSNGVTMTNVNKDKFGKIEILYPNEKLVFRFYDFAVNIFQRILTLGKENIKLAEARDDLLQKLMSGKIKI